MRNIDNILNLLTPDYLVHKGFKLTDRRQRQHILGIIFIALCTLAFNADMGQAGIGAVNQAKVSNYRPVPQNAVIAQPKMLFLFLDHHLDSPSLEISADNFLHRHIDIIGNQCYNSFVTFPFREYNFDFTEFIHCSDTLSKLVTGSFTQTGNAVPYASSIKDIPAIFANLVFNGIECKPSVGLADAYIVPFPLFAGIDNLRTKIKGVEQDRYLEFIGNIGAEYYFCRQFGELFKWNTELSSVFFFYIQPGAKGYSYASIEHAGLENSMSHAILTAGMMMDFTDRLHFFCTLDGLGVIDDQHAVMAAFFVKPLELLAGLCLHNSSFIETASPEKFTMIGSVGAVPKQIDQPLYGAAVADTDSYDQAAKVAINVSRNHVFGRLEKKFNFFRYFADSKHTASLLTSYCYYNTYRQERLFLFNYYYHQNSLNRSV